MEQLSREQVENILNRAPQGMQPEQIIKSLVGQGYQIQGLNLTQQDLASQGRPQSRPQMAGRPQIVGGETPEKQGFFRRLIDPAVGFGESIAGGILGATKGNKALRKATEETFAQQEQILGQIRDAREKGEDTTRLLEALKLNSEAISKIPNAEEINPALMKATKEVWGEAAGTLGLLTLGGALGGGGLSTKAGLRITGALAGSSFAAGESLRKDEDAAEVFKSAIKGGLWGLAGAELGIQVAARVPKLLSIFTGESDQAVRAAMSNPALADTALKNGDVALRTAVQEAAQTSIELKNKFIQGHSQSFNQIAGDVLNNKVQKATLVAQMKSKLVANGVKVSKGKLDFTTSKLQANPGEATRIKQAWEAINAWDDWTVGGVNKYKQLVGQLTGFFDEGGKAAKSQFLSGFYGDVAETVKSQIPQAKRAAYETMNKRFSDNIGLYDDMVTAFNSGDPFQRMAGVFGKNKDALRQTVDFFESRAGQTITPVVGAREIGLHKQAAFGFLNPRSWIDFFIQPSTQGRVVTGAGRAGQVAGKARDTLTKKVSFSQGATPSSGAKTSLLKRMHGDQGGFVKNPLAQKSLAVEAKKYKSADAFVKSHGDTVYHGGSVKRDMLDISKAGSKEQGFGAKAGLWFSKDKTTAAGYGKKVGEFQVKLSKPKIIDAKGKMYGDMRELIDTQVPLAKQNGYDGVIIKNLSDEKNWGVYNPTDHYVIFNTDGLHTKSQLTDIWKKANQ